MKSLGDILRNKGHPNDDYDQPQYQEQDGDDYDQPQYQAQYGDDSDQPQYQAPGDLLLGCPGIAAGSRGGSTENIS